MVYKTKKIFIILKVFNEYSSKWAHNIQFLRKTIWRLVFNEDVLEQMQISRVRM